MIWALLVVGVGQFLVALVLGEVVSQYPIAGGVHPWARRLRGTALGVDDRMGQGRESSVDCIRSGAHYRGRDTARARNALRRLPPWPVGAGLEGVTLHTLRHSAASFLFAAGTHTKVVQEHLGHSSYAITADVYSHVAPAQAREAADRMDEALQW